MKKLLPISATLFFLLISTAKIAAQDAISREAVNTFLNEVFNKHNMFVINEVVAETYTFRNILDQSERYDRKQMKLFLPAFIFAFPDISCRIDDIISEGNKVAVRATLRGTHKNEVWGLQPSGKEIIYPVEVFFLLEYGSITQSWMKFDKAALITQLSGDELSSR